MGKVRSMHGRVHKCIKILRSIILNVGDLLGRCDVEWIIVTCGMDQLQCWWTQMEPSGSLKSGTFLDSLSSCWLCKRGCAVCWVTWEGAGIADWSKWLSCGQNDKGITVRFLALPSTPIPALYGPLPPPVHLVLRVKWLGHEANHSYLSSARVKNVWSCTSTSHYTLIMWCLIKHKDSCLYI